MSLIGLEMGYANCCGARRDNPRDPARVHRTGAVAQVSGHAVPIDGDTIEIAGEHVRLHGIDAPEIDQECTDATGTAFRGGERATRALRALMDGQTVS